MPEYKIIGVCFPNSNKVYEYLISAEVLSVVPTYFIRSGFMMQIENEVGYRYRDQWVTPVSFRDYEFSADLLKITKILKHNAAKLRMTEEAAAALAEFQATYPSSKIIITASADSTNSISSDELFCSAACSSHGVNANKVTFDGTFLDDFFDSTNTYSDSTNPSSNSTIATTIPNTITTNTYTFDTAGTPAKQNKKEVSTMNLNNITKKFHFGKAETVKMSIYGPAFKGVDGNHYAFVDNGLEDVTGMTIDGDFFYEMPVAIKDIAVGDIILHMGKYVKVTCVKEDYDRLVCIDPFTSTEITAIPAKSPFGFDFVTKLVNLFGSAFNNIEASAENPFGNMLPFFMMQNCEGDKLMPLMMMSMASGNTNMNGFNPMMLLLMNK